MTMKRRTTLGAMAGSLMATFGLAASNGSAANSGTTVPDGRVSRAVDVLKTAREQARRRAVGLRSEVGAEKAKRLGMHARQKLDQVDQLIERTKSTSSGWEALELSRKASVYSSFVKGLHQVENGKLSQSEITSKRSQSRSKIDARVSNAQTGPRSDSELVVLAEMHRSLRAARKHTDDVERLLTSDDRSTEVNVAQAFAELEAATGNLSDVALIRKSNTEKLKGGASSSPSVTYESLIDTARTELNGTSTSKDSFAEAAVEAPQRFVEKAESYRSMGLDAGATVAALKTFAYTQAVDSVVDVPNPWNTSESVSLDAAESDKEAAVSTVESQLDGSDNPLDKVLLSIADGKILSGNRLMDRAQRRSDPKDSDALTVADANYRMVETLAEPIEKVS